MPTESEIKHYRNPFPTTDLIIEHSGVYEGVAKSGIVLITRKNPPRGLALPGGFAEWGISLPDNAIKEGREETGLDIILEDPKNPLCVMSDPKRDPRGHMISITYIARGYGVLRKGDFYDARNPSLYEIPEVIELIKRDKLVFDHAQIIERYLQAKGYAK